MTNNSMIRVTGSLLAMGVMISSGASSSILQPPMEVHSTYSSNEYNDSSASIQYYELKTSKHNVELEAERIFGQMRDATNAERMVSQNYMMEHSTPLGINFWD